MLSKSSCLACANIYDDEIEEELEKDEVYKNADKLLIVNPDSGLDNPSDEEDWASEEDVYDLPPKFFFKCLSW